MGLFSRFIAKVKGQSTASSLDWSEIEAELLQADLGPTLVADLISEGKKVKGDDAESAIRQLLHARLSLAQRELVGGSPQIVLVVGINGAGKTTSVAKLAFWAKGSGKRVVLGAADTFRAAAVEQLATWGTRVGVDVVTGKGDTSAVAFDTAKSALASGADIVIIDTAGRLHTKNDLMQELGKVQRVIEKNAPVTDVLLVIDGTSGQNGLAQAAIFKEAVGVTGLIVTKLDGSARGGVALAIESALNLPIKFIGTGESMEDLTPFSAEEYINGLLA